MGDRPLAEFLGRCRSLTQPHAVSNKPNMRRALPNRPDDFAAQQVSEVPVSRSCLARGGRGLLDYGLWSTFLNDLFGERTVDRRPAHA
jgi:hypothetical protein